MVRHCRRGGYVIAPILGDRFFGAPRLVLELQWSRRLAEAGVATPAFLAGVWHRSGLLHRADVATEHVAGTDLASLMFSDSPPRGADRAAVLAAVARLVRRMHDAGIVHPDLQLKNVLVGDGPAACLLDVDTCRLAGGTESRRLNLRRFHRSWQKWNRRFGERLTAADWDAFEAAYAAAGVAA